MENKKKNTFKSVFYWRFLNIFVLHKIFLSIVHLLATRKQTHLKADFYEWVGKKIKKLYIKFLLPSNSNFHPSYRRNEPIRSRSNFTFTAVIMLPENCEFGAYPRIADAYVKDWSNVGRPKELSQKRTPNIPAEALNFVFYITTEL